MKSHPTLPVIVSKAGVIYKNGEPMSTSKNSPYLYISLKGKPYPVHRLVAETYLDNPENYKVVNHMDCDKKNNCLNNLEWTTHQENIQHAMDNGRRHREFSDKTKREKWDKWTSNQFWGLDVLADD